MQKGQLWVWETMEKILHVLIFLHTCTYICKHTHTLFVQSCFVLEE